MAIKQLKITGVIESNGSGGIVSYDLFQALGTNAYAIDTGELVGYDYNNSFTFNASFENTNDSSITSIDVAGLGAKDLKMKNGLALPVGILSSEETYTVNYDSVDDCMYIIIDVLKTDVSYTLGVEFETIQSFIDFFSDFKTISGECKLMITSDVTISSQILIENISGNICIETASGVSVNIDSALTGETVTINDDSILPLFYLNNAKLGKSKIDIAFEDGVDYDDSHCGILAHNDSSIDISDSNICINTPNGIGVIANKFSYVTANAVVCSYCGAVGIRASSDSTIFAANAICLYVGYGYVDGIGVLAENNSRIYATGLQATDSVSFDVKIKHNSYVNISDGTVTNINVDRNKSTSYGTVLDENAEGDPPSCVYDETTQIRYMGLDETIYASVLKLGMTWYDRNDNTIDNDMVEIMDATGAQSIQKRLLACEPNATMLSLKDESVSSLTMAWQPRPSDIQDQVMDLINVYDSEQIKTKWAFKDSAVDYGTVGSYTCYVNAASNVYGTTEHQPIGINIINTTPPVESLSADDLERRYFVGDSFSINKHKAGLSFLDYRGTSIDLESSSFEVDYDDISQFDSMKSLEKIDIWQKTPSIKVNAEAYADNLLSLSLFRTGKVDRDDGEIDVSSDTVTLTNLFAIEQGVKYKLSFTPSSYVGIYTYNADGTYAGKLMEGSVSTGIVNFTINSQSYIRISYNPIDEPFISISAASTLILRYGDSYVETDQTWDIAINSSWDELYSDILNNIKIEDCTYNDGEFVMSYSSVDLSTAGTYTVKMYCVDRVLNIPSNILTITLNVYIPSYPPVDTSSNLTRTFVAGNIYSIHDLMDNVEFTDFDGNTYNYADDLANFEVDVDDLLTAIGYEYERITITAPLSKIKALTDLNYSTSTYEPIDDKTQLILSEMEYINERNGDVLDCATQYKIIDYVNYNLIGTYGFDVHMVEEMYLTTAMVEGTTTVINEIMPVEVLVDGDINARVATVNSSVFHESDIFSGYEIHDYRGTAIDTESSLVEVSAEDLAVVVNYKSEKIVSNTSLITVDQSDLEQAVDNPLTTTDYIGRVDIITGDDLVYKVEIDDSNVDYTVVGSYNIYFKVMDIYLSQYNFTININII
jgi:hypothetical protein